jgi:iron complex outermembrane receptor protein
MHTDLKIIFREKMVNKARGHRHQAVGDAGESLARKDNVKKTVIGPLLILVLGILVVPAFAQVASPGARPSAPPDAAPRAQATPTVQGVEEIVVTAQKREELSQHVPIALTALTAETIRFRGIDDLSDLAMQVPGMQYTKDSIGNQQLYIRGIGVDDTSATVESPVATYVDGVYQPRTFRSPTLGIDLERVEVLKGPQGTLFGRNATGGAVNIILTPPSDELTGIAKVGGGSYGQVLTQGAVSGPLIKHILDLRVSGAFSRDDGWIINEINGRPVNNHNEGDGRLALAFHPLANLEADYELLASKLTGGGTTATVTNIVVGPPALQKAQGLPYVIPPSTYINGNNPWKGKFDYPFQGDMENTQNSLIVKWDFAPWASLKSISAFQEHSVAGSKFDDTGTAFPTIQVNGRDIDDKFFSQELNLGGSQPLLDWGNFSWLVGAYYGNENYSSAFGDVFVNNYELLVDQIGREKLNDYSVFGDTTIPLPWNFSLFGGVRYTYDRKTLNQTDSLRFSTVGFGPPYTPPLNIPGTTCSALNFTDNFHNVSPRVGMGWAPLESLNFYVKYSEGYNAGGHYYFNCDNGYKAETLDSVEGGVKARWFDGRLVVEAAGYYNDFKNFQVFQVVGIHTELINAPEAEMWGGEFAVSALPTDNLTVNLGLSVMHSQYDNFHDTDSLNPAAGLQNLSGNQTERAPNHTEQVGLEYAWPVPWGSILGERADHFLNLGTLRMRGEWFHTDYIIFRPFGGTGFSGANDRQNPYSIFNFYATLPTEDGKWSLRFFAKNFTNTKYYSYKIALPEGYDGIGGAPPWFGGDLTYRF